jgi:hypothetical protein
MLTFISGVFVGVFSMIFIGFMYALRKPHKLRKPIEDFQKRKENKLYQDLLNKYETTRKN